MCTKMCESSPYWMCYGWGSANILRRSRQRGLWWTQGIPILRFEVSEGWMAEKALCISFRVTGRQKGCTKQATRFYRGTAVQGRDLPINGFRTCPSTFRMSRELIEITCLGTTIKIASCRLGRLCHGMGLKGYVLTRMKYVC
jgi:hypothetical protein